MRQLVSVVFAMAICVAAGCASSQRSADGDRAVINGGSGVTVFGTIDANVSGSRNR